MRRWIRIPTIIGASLGLATALPAQQQPQGARPAPPPIPPQQAVPAQAQAPPQAPEVDPQAQQRLDAILEQWAKQSAKIEILGVDFEQVETQAIINEKKTYEGRAYLKRPNLAVLDLKRRKDDGTAVFERRIQSTGKAVIEWDAEARQITIFPMPEDDRERALEEGPLPFLFRMDVAAFKERYKAVLKEETDRYYRLGIYPRHPVDREAFFVAALYLDKRTLLPLKISTLAPNMKDSQDYVIKKVMLNDQLAHVSDRTFTWTAETEQWARQQNPPWKIVRNPPPGEAAIRQVPPAAPAPAQAGRAVEGRPVPR